MHNFAAPTPLSDLAEKIAHFLSQNLFLCEIRNLQWLGIDRWPAESDGRLIVVICTELRCIILPDQIVDKLIAANKRCTSLELLLFLNLIFIFDLALHTRTARVGLTDREIEAAIRCLAHLHFGVDFWSLYERFFRKNCHRIVLIVILIHVGGADLDGQACSWVILGHSCSRCCSCPRVNPLERWISGLFALWRVIAASTDDAERKLRWLKLAQVFVEFKYFARNLSELSIGFTFASAGA